jgi:hypothetical protein
MRRAVFDDGVAQSLRRAFDQSSFSDAENEFAQNQVTAMSSQMSSSDDPESPSANTSSNSDSKAPRLSSMHKKLKSSIGSVRRGLQITRIAQNQMSQARELPKDSVWKEVQDLSKDYADAWVDTQLLCSSFFQDKNKTGIAPDREKEMAMETCRQLRQGLATLNYMKDAISSLESKESQDKFARKQLLAPIAHFEPRGSVKIERISI